MYKLIEWRLKYFEFLYAVSRLIGHKKVFFHMVKQYNTKRLTMCFDKYAFTAKS